MDQWDIFWEAIRPVELSSNIEPMAGQLTATHSLRGADAVHLASALALGPNVTIAVWDKRLHAGVIASGLATAPATFD